MFILHSSNRTENLSLHLVKVIESMPLSDPFAQEIFLIQSQGMERWLSQQLAHYLGVWGNYNFLFPNEFFNRLGQRIDPHFQTTAFDRSLMIWRFEQLLRQLDDDCFEPIRIYLNGDNSALKRFQLASQLAQVFDQYQIMRPDMLASWQQGQDFYQHESEPWQRLLWQKLIQSVTQPHRGLVWQQLIDQLNQMPIETGILPERAFIFGLNTLPPLFLELLKSFSRHLDIHLFLLNPTQIYWADLYPNRQLEADSEAHPLLVTLGQQGREFQQMLLDQVEFSHEVDSFSPPPEQTNLQQLQADILNNQFPHRCLQTDGSIQLHACHSRIREIEVLKDQLLEALAKDNSLQLRDIIVMAPDIQHYAPFISAIFHDIQHSIADRSLAVNNRCLDALIRFLKLTQSRLGWQSVLDLLEQPMIYTRFDLSEPDLITLRQWLTDTHVRWGKSGEHKRQFELPPLNENTWQATLDRLLMGYAVGHHDQLVEGILPYREIEGSSALALGGLYDFLQLLFIAGDELKQSACLQTWGQRLHHYTEQLLNTAEAEQSSEYQQLNTLLEELGTTALLYQQPISLQVIIAWLETRMLETTSSNGFLRGQLTFCSMLPMRSIPCKVIALMGLNDGEFPKMDSAPSFDLISQHFRSGDRSRRADDRYQFLEMLLSARQQLIMTYIGQSIQHNEAIPPSVIVSELIEVLKNNYQLTDWIIQHPLQAFSYRYFETTEKLFSYSQADYTTATCLQSAKPTNRAWWQGKLKTAALTVIEIDDLMRFFKQPQDYFLAQLGLKLRALSSHPEEREIFELDSLERYLLYQQWIEKQLAGENYPLQHLQAQGNWLQGRLGELEYNRQQLEINEFVKTIKQYSLGQKQADQVIDIKLGKVHLVGQLSHCYQQGSLWYRYAKLKGKDFIRAWLHHEIINQVQTQNTVLLATDQTFTFSAADHSEQTLMALIEIYQQGCQQPDSFFTEASFAYIQQAAKLKISRQASTPARQAAEQALINEMKYNLSLQQLYRNFDDPRTILPDHFEAHCEQLILPIWTRCHETNHSIL